jgi:hypothetical protein
LPQQSRSLGVSTSAVATTAPAQQFAVVSSASSFCFVRTTLRFGGFVLVSCDSQYSQDVAWLQSLAPSAQFRPFLVFNYSANASCITYTASATEVSLNDTLSAPFRATVQANLQSGFSLANFCMAIDTVAFFISYVVLTCWIKLPHSATTRRRARSKENTSNVESAMKLATFQYTQNNVDVC